jgi:hypothetical protein
MIRAMGIVQAILLTSTAVALAQGNSTRDVPQGTQPPNVLTQTGTMYDGNNTNLQLPAEPNGYWADRWAAPMSASTPNVGGAAASVGGPSAGGVH